MQAYRVKQWDQVHETAESRKYKTLSWAAMPLKHDGLGFRHTVRQSDRNDLLAAWYMILQVAGKGQRGIRGWLVREGKPLTTSDLHLMTGVSEGTFKRAIEHFVNPPSDWLELAEFSAKPEASPGAPGESPGMPEASPASPLIENSTVQDSTQYKGKKKGSGPGSGASVAASRTQFAAIQAEVREMERRVDDLTAAERCDLRKKRQLLRDLQKKQAAGDFTPIPERPATTQPQPQKDQ